MPGVESNRVCFLLKDPHWTFIWWELDASALELALRATEQADSFRFTIRIRDVTSPCIDATGGGQYLDIEVTGLTDHWYARIPESGRAYVAEVGFKTEAKFYCLGRSSTIRLPRERPSDPAEQQWSTIRIPD
jgi:hypothetical protein